MKSLFALALLVAFKAGAVDLSNLTTALQNSPTPWVKVNLNAQADAFTPVELRPAGGSPTTISGAWSSFAWDSQRGYLIQLGGGHGNYSGNELMLFAGQSQTWGRGSLPSQITGVTTANGVAYMPVDFAAPTSMHTYDNSMYLPVLDRYLVLNGPSWNYSGGPVKADGTPTGPFMWNPGLADANKVAGTTGSGVNPATLGTNAWTNLDKRMTISIWSGEHGLNLTDGTSAVTVSGGRDVVYFTGVAAGNQWLMKYTPDDNVLTTLGANGGAAIYGAAGLDPTRGWYVGPADNGTGFAGYSTAGGNGITLNVSGPAFSGGQISGIDFDPVRGNFLVWTGAGDVWRLSEPANGQLSGQWTLDKVTDGASFAAGLKPDDMNVSGVRGKWHYIPNLDAFMAQEGTPAGEVWLYRPDGWVNPVPELPTVPLLAAGLACVGWIAKRRARVEH